MKNVEYIVYKITNKLNGKVYIGQTTEGIEKRWKRHCGYQINDGTYFHNAIKKYGAENFTIEIIDKAKNQEELNELEFFYINITIIVIIQNLKTINVEAIRCHIIRTYIKYGKKYLIAKNMEKIQMQQK